MNALKRSMRSQNFASWECSLSKASTAMSSAMSLAVISMSVPFLLAVGVVRDAKCTGAGTGAINPLAGGVMLLSAHAVLLPCQGVMASPGLVPGLFLRGVHGCMVGWERFGVSVFRGLV